MHHGYPINDRSFRILIIGAVHAPPVNEIIPLLRGLGYELIIIGATKAPYDNPESKELKNSGFFTITHLNLLHTHTIMRSFNMTRYQMGMPQTNQIREMKLESLLDVLGYDHFDFILHFEDFIFFTETQKFRIPYFYVKSECWHSYFPKCAWKIYTATTGIEALVNDLDKNILTATMGTSPLSIFYEKPSTIERTVRSSFAGSLYTFNELYQERRDIVNFLERDLPDQFEAHCAGGHWDAFEDKKIPPKGLGKLSLPRYIELLKRTQIGVNIPTVWGANYRDVEICAIGAMLLTKKTDDHEQLGFIDGVNCKYYETAEEAKWIIQNIPDNERIRIAEAGKILATGKLSYMMRVMALIQDIKKVLSGEKGSNRMLPEWNGVLI